ncbi:MAG: hypothetical protein JWN93_2499 [Hyphomicrobiales bacterium]|nr:hypothetical protein [Hyphomicrobiales bacterium]
MACAAAALESAARQAQGDSANQLALIAEVVSTQKDLAAGLAALVKSAPGDMVDLLLASAAFARGGDAMGRH